MTGSCRLTVVGEGRRADLSVPASVPLADLVAELADLVLGRSPDALPAPLVLARPTGPALSLDRSLEELGIVDGEVLVLREATEASDVPVVDDLAEAVGEALQRRAGRWSPDQRRRLVPLAGALVAALGGLALIGPLSGALGAPPALALALALLAAGAVLERLRDREWAGAALALASLPWFAAGAAALFEAAAPGRAATVAGAGVGVLIGSGPAIFAAPRLVAPVAGLGVAAVAAGVAGGAMLAGFGAVEVAAVLAVVLVAGLYVLPAVAMRASGLVHVPDRATVSEVAEVVEQGRQLLPALLAGTAVAATVAATVLAWAGAGAAPFLAAAVAGCLLLRARSLDFTGEVVAVGGSGLAASVIVGAAVGARVPGLGAAAIPLVAVLAGLGLAVAVLAGGSVRSPGWRRFLSRAELAGAIALIPLCLAVVGFFAVVADLGQSLGLSR